MGSRRRSLLGGKRTGGSEESELLGDGGTDEVTTPAAPAPEPAAPPPEEPLTDPSASGPFLAEFLRKPDPGDADLLQAPVPPPPRSEPAPAPAARPAAPPPAPSVEPVAWDTAPARAPTPSPPPSRALPEPRSPEPSYVQFDAPPAAPPPVQPKGEARPDAWGEGWNPAGSGPTPLADAPVARDLFQGTGFEELEEIPPPTEEQPAGVLEDVGQSYSTPYSVPEPPPIPGLVDRFTPPPVQRTELGERKRKPDYLPDTPGGAANRGYEPTPAPVARRKAAKEAPVESERSGPPILLLAGIGALGLFGVGLILVAVAVFFGSSGDDNGAGLAPNQGGTTVETRNDMRRRPQDFEQPVPEPAPAPVPVEAPAPAAPAPGAAPTSPSPSPTPAPGPRPVQPVPAPPKPPPEPSKAAPAPASQGILKIRANRRAMVYVNNQVVGFTPLDHKVAPGTWSVAAVLPGQPTTRQERTVSAPAAGGTTAVDFTF